MAKRLLDIVLSILGLLVLSPVLLLISGLIVIKLGWPIFFTQTRPGISGKPFKLIKFRTMTNERDSDGQLRANEKRMTPFGSLLRSYSLDELPELFNVLKGEMSMVGPRPLLMDYLPYFSKVQHRRHEVKPGITGWAQVNGRNAIGWDTKLDLDVWYVDHQSVWLDLKILWQTMAIVIERDGINHNGQVTMPRFDEYVKNQRTES